MITIITSFFTGATLGAGVALLYSPKSGKETREEIAKLSTDLTEKVREYGRVAQTTIENAIEEGKKSIAENKSIFMSAIDAGKDAMQKEKERIVIKS